MPNQTTVQAVMHNPLVSQTAILTAMQAVNLTAIQAIMANPTTTQVVTPTTIPAVMANLAAILTVMLLVL